MFVAYIYVNVTAYMNQFVVLCKPIDTSILLCLKVMFCMWLNKRFDIGYIYVWSRYTFWQEAGDQGLIALSQEQI